MSTIATTARQTGRTRQHRPHHPGHRLDVRRRVPEEQPAGDLQRREDRSPSTRASRSNLTGEVQQHLGGGRVRCVALGSTDGLIRGMDCVDTGAPVTVPVGKATLGRVFNLLGEPIDGRGPVDAEEYWPIHRDAARGDRSVDQDRNVRDRHQGDRPADAVRPRRQGRPVRRGRSGQDGHPHRADRPHRQSATAATRCSPASASGPAKATTSGSKCRKPRSATPAATSSSRPAWSSAR